MGARVAPDIRDCFSLSHVCKVTRVVWGEEHFMWKVKEQDVVSCYITCVNPQTLTCIRITWPPSKDTDCWAPPFSFWFSSSGVDLGICISNQFPGVADAARHHGLETTEADGAIKGEDYYRERKKTYLSCNFQDKNLQHSPGNTLMQFWHWTTLSIFLC